MKRVLAVMIGMILVLAALGAVYADYSYTPLNYPGAADTLASGINNGARLSGRVTRMAFP